MTEQNANIQIVRATGLLVIEAINSNPNGDPDRESDPRQRPDGRGEISPVSFKRKVRDLIENKAGEVLRGCAGRDWIGFGGRFVVQCGAPGGPVQYRLLRTEQATDRRLIG